MTSQGTSARGDTVHVFQANVTGLPHLPTYFRQFRDRMEFAKQMSRTTLRVQQADSSIGKIWLVLNPLMLSGVYYFLIVAIGSKNQGPGFFAHLVSGVFIFYFVSGCMLNGAGSVVGAGKLISNSSFPRLLLPYAAVRTALSRFIPTLPIFLIFYFIGGGRLHWQQLFAVAAFGLIFMFSLGLASLFAALQVQYRDTTSFLPYINRIWLYISPVLFYPEDARNIFKHISVINPLFPLLSLWSHTLVQGTIPPWTTWLAGFLWAVVCLVGGCWYFLAKEREFAVRL